MSTAEVIVISLSLIAVLFLFAGVRLQYNLLRAFYIRIWGVDYQLLSKNPSKDPYKGAISIDLTISNQQDKPNGIARFVLLVQYQNGRKGHLDPVSLNDNPEINILSDGRELIAPLYFQPHEPQTGQINFVHNERVEYKSEKLCIFDDRGTYHSVPIDVDTMVKMSKKSTARSEDYQIE
jgi:hypothetical protein